MRFGRFFCFAILCLWSFHAALSQPVEILSHHKEMEIGAAVEFMEDPEGKLGIDAIKAFDKERWQQSHASVPNFGFTNSAYWLKFTFQGEADKSRSMLLQIAYPALDSLELYVPQPDGSYAVKKTGDRQLFQERDLNNRNFLFKLEIEGHQTYYLRCETKGSMKIPLKLFDPEHFQQVDEMQVIEIGFFCGIIIAMLLYNSFLAVTIRDINYVYYIGYIGLLLVFTISLNGIAYQYLWPRNVWLANYSIPLAISGSSFFALQFSSRFLRTDRFAPLIDKFISLIKIWALVSVGFMPFIPYKTTTQSSTALVLFVNFSLMAAGILLVRRGHRSARFYMLAFAAIWCGMAAKALQTLGLIPVSSFSENGVIIGSMMEVILLSLALGDKIHHRQQAAQKKIETLNRSLADTIKSLDAKVDEQTSEIKSMLGNIKQGIFMVELVNQVPVLKADFSEHLTDILGTRDLAGKPLMKCVFERSNLSTDELSMIQSVMISCLGEPLIAYEVNAQQLPNEFSLNDGSGHPRTIEIEWCPVLSKDGVTVQSFLVTLRDVSSYRILQAQSQDQQDELRYTSELLNFPNATFLRFVQLCQDLLQENRRLISALRSRDPEVLKIMFINMHTLKGAARQLGLSRLTSQIHAAEQIFADLNKNEKLLLNPPQIMRALQDCELALQRYIDINHSKLGRSTTTDEVTIGRSTLENVVRFFRQMTDLPLSLQARQELKQLNQSLTDIVYHSSEKVLNDILKQANTLAKDLHKADPEINIQAIPVNLTAAGEDLLRKVFLHLIRNSLDHGIEFPDERLAKGKTPSGTIQVVMDQPDSQSMRICYRDDGRGINITKLKQIARDFGLLKDEELQDPLKIAYSIFADGISTSKSVTDISGRGVGMGAIKEYVERLGGSIELKLYSNDTESGFLPFELVLYAPSEKLVA
jgi:signal transduction histidine kinase